MTTELTQSTENTVPLSELLFYSGDIPNGLSDWCLERGIAARLYSLVDGGGFCGYAVGFPNEEICQEVALHFPPRSSNYPMGEMLYRERFIGKVPESGN